jgi:steroid 5-alpha reductase family enzyme
MTPDPIGVCLRIAVTEIGRMLTILILLVVVGLAAVMALAWAAERATGNTGWADVFWTIGTGLAGICFAVCPAVFSGSAPTPRQIVLAALVMLWLGRLSVHIAMRVSKGHEDARYTVLRNRWGSAFPIRLFGFLQLQAICGAALALTVLVAALNPSPGLRALDFIGLAVFAAGLIGESIADGQLRRFAADPDRRGGICMDGLWAWSRHPNYFFEWLVWLAYPCFAITLSGNYLWGWLALLGPAFSYYLLAHVSGVPPLEEHLLRSRGTAYRDYQQRTNSFFLGPQH